MLATTSGARQKRVRSNIFSTVAGVIALTTAMLLGGLTPAFAAVGDSSSARGQFLSGSLVGTDLATLAALQGADAVSNGTADDLDTGSLSVAVLQALQLEIAGGVQVPLDGVDLGVLEQYAAANADGSALGASGAVANDGAIGVGPLPPGGAPTAMTFDLSQLLAGVVNVGAVTDLHLELGAVSAQATGNGVVAPTGDYEIAGLRLVIDSPAVSGIAGAVSTAVDGVVDPLVDGLVGPDGSVLSSITGAVPALTLTTVGAGATLNVDTASALAPLIGPGAPALGAGSPIEIDLGTGVITVDVRALLESDADPTNDLNSLDPNTEILSAGVLTLITDGVESLLDDLADDIAAAVVTAVNNAVLTVDLNVSILGFPNVATIHVGGTVGDLIASTPGSVVVNVLNAAVCLVPVVGNLICSTLAALVLSTLDGVLTAAVNGLVNDVLAAVQADVIVPALLLLDPALGSIVTDIVSLRANVQEPTPPLLTQEFVETALRLTLLGVTMPGGGAAILNIAQAAVGPNVAADPVASNLSPNRGPETGGTVVTITGANIGDATSVTFGGTPGTGVIRLSDDSISVIAPPHTPATVDVVVIGPGGSTAPLPFEFYAVVTIDDITPDSGPEAGGTQVVITGHCFTATTDVTFDGNSVLDFTVDSDTQLTVHVPAGVGLVDVTVTTGSTDCGSGTEPGGYAYVAPGAPVITGMVPVLGPETGFTAVTLTGAGFLGATSVTFDGTAGTSFVVVDDTTITVLSPPHVPAIVNVVVTHPVGNSAPEDFEYYPIMAIDSITPNQGPEAGGTGVVILGHCFLGATQLLFGVTPASNFVVVSDTRIDAVAPAGVGLVDVTVTGAGTCGTGIEPDGFTFVAPTVPAITGITPPEGPATGGTLVTITGTGFTGVTSVTFDGVAGTSLVVVSDTVLTVRTPAHVPQIVDVVVIDPVDGTSAPGVFEFIAVAVGGVTITPTGVLGLTGSSPWLALLGAITLLFAGLAVRMTDSLRRRRRLL
ncbi:hypothetical protein BH09ACT4_BH09ACT4_18180 [soil metagenome]